MKARTLLLIGSLLANAVLLAAVAWRQSTGNKESDSLRRAGEVAADGHAGAASQNPSAAKAPGGPTDGAAAARQAGRAFLGGDLKTMVTRLRAAGFPMEAIREMVYVEIDHRVLERERAAAGPIKKMPYWEPRFGIQRMIDQDVASARAKQAARERLGAEALGEDRGEFTPEGQELLQRLYGDLPPETSSRILRIVTEHDEKRLLIQKLGYNSFVFLRDERAQLDRLEDEQHAAIARLLTPEQLEAYDIRNDTTSSRLRSQFAEVGLNEEQFLALYRWQRAQDKISGGKSVSRSPEELERQRLAQQELDAEVLSLLSPEQALRYRIATDPAYNEIDKVATRFGLPAQTAIDVVALQRTTQASVAALRKETALTPAQLEMLQRDVETQLTAMLGSPAYQAYRETGARWIADLRAPVRQAAPPTPER